YVIKANPDNPTLHDHRGRVLAEMGEWKAAADDFRKALEWYFQYDRSRTAFDRSLVNMDQWDRYAMAALTAGDTAGYRSFCTTCLKLYGAGDDPQAIDNLELAQIERVTALARYGAPQPADLAHFAKLAQRAVAIQPRSPWTQLTLGAIQYRQG